MVPRGVRARGARCCGRPGVGGAGTEADRYLRIAMLRYLLLITHEWTDEVIERLLGEVRAPRADDDTMVHQILTELR